MTNLPAVAPGLATPDPSAHPRVLIVEDERDLGEILCQTIQADLGWQCHLATDGQSGWQLVQDQPVDVVISDWMLPGLDGAEFCRRVRGRVGAPYAYFIFETALGDSAHLREAMEAGADDYLVKPFDLDQLVARLLAARRVVRQHRRIEGLLRVARQCAAEARTDALLERLTAEGAWVFEGAPLLAYRWNEQRQQIEPLPHATTSQPIAAPLAAFLAETAAAVARTRQARLSHTPHAQGLAAPLLHDGRLLGALAVASSSPSPAFGADDLAALELLAGIAAASLQGLERARLEGVLLAARTAEHTLNNQLALTVGYAELLATHSQLPAELRGLSDEALRGAREAAQTVAQLRRVTRLAETDLNDPSGPILDLTRSA